MASKKAIKPEELAARIDHTLLKPDATKADIERLCDEAVKNTFAAVVVNSEWLPLCHGVLSEINIPSPGDVMEESPMAAMLGKTAIPVCTVVSFPLGADSITIKTFAAEDAVRKGASEIDMVLNIAYVKEGMWEEIEEEVRLVGEGMAKFALGDSPVLKVIIETALLTEDEITMTAKRVVAGGATFVKTNTGFFGEGASIEHVKLIRDTIGDDAKIKASGGIRTLDQAVALIEAGADRIGTSTALDIMAEAKAAGK